MSAINEHAIPGVWVIVAEPSPGRYAVQGGTAEQVREQFHRGFPGFDGEPSITPGGWDAVAELVSRGLGPIVDPYVYEPDPARPGFLKLIRMKSVREVYEEIRAIVCEYPDGAEEYLSVTPGHVAWPQGARTVVYAVNGSSEGDYVHIEAHVGSHRIPLMLGKTFMGRDAAWLFARKVADLLGA